MTYLCQYEGCPGPREAVVVRTTEFDGEVVVSAAYCNQHAIEVGDMATDHEPSNGVRPPLPTDVKMYRYVLGRVRDYTTPPFEVDYITSIDGRLHPTNSVIVDGEVRRTDFYADAVMDAQGNVTYSDLIVREDFIYTRDSIGFARSRVQTITWYTEDDEPHPSVKIRNKMYERDESMREGIRRRGNIGDKLAMDLAGWLYVTQTQLPNPQDRLDLGRQFMRDYKLSFDMFVDASSSQILYDIRDDTTSAWLDSLLAPGLTIRAKLLDDLNIWNLTL